MFTDTDWLIHLEHHKDLLREVEKERLLKIALSAVRVRKEKKTKSQQSEALNFQTIACCPTATA